MNSQIKVHVMHRYTKLKKLNVQPKGTILWYCHTTLFMTVCFHRSHVDFRNLSASQLFKITRKKWFSHRIANTSL